jgi:hypothetical protein
MVLAIYGHIAWLPQDILAGLLVGVVCWCRWRLPGVWRGFIKRRSGR